RLRVHGAGQPAGPGLRLPGRVRSRLGHGLPAQRHPLPTHRRRPPPDRAAQPAADPGLPVRGGPMSDEVKAPEEVILTRLMRLNALVYGVVAGLVAGLGLLVATLWLVAKGGTMVGGHLGLLGHYFPGYSVTCAGGSIGFAF